MAGILGQAFETYRDNIRLVLLFSIPFIIAFLIPLFAPLPTFLSGGAIFLRSASIFLNINALGLAVIIGSSFLSLLFLSFAFVAISLIVKAKRTMTRHAGNVIAGIERYTAKVFVVLLAYSIVLTLVDIFSYFFGMEGVITPIVGFVLFMAMFYAPTAIVIDNRGIAHALKQSWRMIASEPQYFILWVVMITIVVSILDFLVITATGTLLSGYVLLVLNSLFVLPYFIIFQAEAYMKRFSILKH